MPKNTQALEDEIARLRGVIESSKKAPGKLTFKVSEKGALSIYGMGRFPTTLYKEQWKRLIEAAPEIAAFIVANDAQLKSKES